MDPATKVYLVKISPILADCSYSLTVRDVTVAHLASTDREQFPCDRSGDYSIKYFVYSQISKNDLLIFYQVMGFIIPKSMTPPNLF